MNAEQVLLSLGFKENNQLTSEYFVLYSKDDSHFFIYENMNGVRMFSSASGEFYGNGTDLITFLYKTENSSVYNEYDRISEFIELFGKNSKLGKPLKRLPKFNLYKYLVGLKKSRQSTDLINCVETNNSFNFLLVDEERNVSGKNILGVVSLNKETNEEKTLVFSELNRSIYFTNPENCDSAFIFNSFSEMLAFKKLQIKKSFYVVVKGQFNKNHAKTISMVLSSKGINKTYLAFPDNLKGYESDIYYLSQFANITIKNKTAYYKLYLPISKESETLIDKVKKFKVHIEKELQNNTIKDLIILREGKDLTGEPNFIIEVAKISNIIKSILVLSSKILFKETEYKIIKPKNVFWFEENTPIKNAPKEYKLNIYNSIKEVYSFN